MRNKVGVKPQILAGDARRKSGSFYPTRLSEFSITKRLKTYKTVLECMLSKPKLPLGKSLLDLLPEEGGVYHIGVKTSRTQWHSLYVGSADNLRDAVVNRHLMGNEKADPIRKGLTARCPLLRKEKNLIEYFHFNCFVQYFQFKNKYNMGLFKHFVISALCPMFND
jgi:hypothetical protein